jgi:aspartate racemase
MRLRDSEKKIIGVLGGMGPEATARFFTLLFRGTRAARDQEHAQVLIWNDPHIPPRTDAVLRAGPSPLPRLLAGIHVLERGGAGLIVMPCLTAHHYTPQIKARTRVPFVDLLEESGRWARRAIPGLKSVGLIASTGTVESGLFHKAFEEIGVAVMIPGPPLQERVMDAIFGPHGVKAGFTTGHPRRAILGVARRLVDRGAQAIVAGCTEVPLVLGAADLTVPFIEPMEIGARACLRRAGYPLK